MAKQSAGESKLVVGGKTITLRLDIGTMMDIEDHFDMGILELFNTRLQEVRVTDFSILMVALTGGDFTDRDEIIAAGQIITEAGIDDTVTAVTNCFVNTLTADNGKKPNGPAKKPRKR